jgi:DNA-binding LacI/PurR family transcriptional regulator
MAQLAQRAGVSEATVSRALAQSPLIAARTRERIQQLARQAGYSINPAASSLRSKITRNVSVAILLEHERRQTISDPFFLVLLGSIADALAERGYSLTLSKVESGAAAWLERAARSRQADGLILIGQSLHHAALNATADSGFPMVVWGARLPDQRYVSIGSDNEQGGFLASAHLIEQGCRDVAFLGNTRVPEVAQRYRGHLRALRARDLPREPRLKLSVHFDSDAAYFELSTLLDSGLRVDGIAASSDVIAMSALRALGERGRRVPGDVAVSGFDDIPLASHTSPPLTTVRQDVARGGRLLVEKLMALIAGEPAESITLPAELIVRASSIRTPARTAITPFEPDASEPTV